MHNCLYINYLFKAILWLESLRHSRCKNGALDHAKNRKRDRFKHQNCPSLFSSHKYLNYSLVLHRIIRIFCNYVIMLEFFIIVSTLRPPAMITPPTFFFIKFPLYSETCHIMGAKWVANTFQSDFKKSQ